MNEGTGAYAGDASGNKNTGTLTGGPTFVDGKRGKALNFDGSNDYVEIPSNSAFDSTTGTWAAWVKKNNGGPIISRHNSSFSLNGITFTAGAYAQIKSGGEVCSLSSAINNNEWYHVALVWSQASGGTNRLYVNGVQMVTCNNSGAWSFSNQVVRIAKSTDTFWEQLDGLIDEVRVYNRALSAGEVSALYKSGATKFNAAPTNLGLVGYWSFNDATSTNTAFPTRAGDFSGNGNNGILTSGPTWVDGKRGKALNFDGANDYVNARSAATVDNIWTNGGTASAWIYARSYGENSRGRIFDKASNNNPDSGWILFTANGGSQQSIVFDLDWSVDVGGAGIWCLATTTQPYPAMNKWTHIAVTYSSSASGNDPTFYVNGVQAPISAYTGCNNNGTGAYQTDAAQNLLIGTSVSGDRSFDGLIDDVRLYKRVLSASEIQTLYQSDYAKVNASQNNQITNGLVGLWSFNGPDMSGTTAFDRSGQGNNGTLTNGPALAAGKIGQALNFDGVDDYIALPEPSTASTNITTGSVFGWIKTTNAGTGYRGISVKQNVYGMFLLDNVFVIYDWVADTSRSTGINLANGKWHFVGFTFQSGVANGTQLYIDGILQLTTTMTGLNQNEGFVIGAGNNPGSVQFFGGLIDEVRVYNRALTPAEIKRLYNMGR